VKTAAFEYCAPGSLDEAIALLGEHGDEAKVLAGGQSLVPLLAMRLARPTVVIDINELDGLSAIAPTDGGGLTLGAMTRERAAERSPDVAARVPVLAEALPLVGHVAIRNRGTVGGSIVHADASGELPAVALVTDAEMVARSTRGERVIAANGFFHGHFTTAMADDELLTEVRIPAGAPGAGWAFDEVARRRGDFALVGAAAMVAMTDGVIGEARIALIGVAGQPVRVPDAEAALVGQPADASTFEAAAREAVAGLEPASDVHGSGEFRRHLAGVVTRRALTAAARRTGGVE
jgi:carbon-monoxide dehydrogenase medium subunit